jgi:hypothetical protein
MLDDREALAAVGRMRVRGTPALRATGGAKTGSRVAFPRPDKLILTRSGKPPACAIGARAGMPPRRNQPRQQAFDERLPAAAIVPVEPEQRTEPLPP